MSRQVAARAASLLLRYPDEPVLGALPLVLTALDGLPGSLAGPLRRVAEYRAGTDPTELAAQYVQLFDFRRRCCLHLTYYTCGDTRNRGEALVRFAGVFAAAGYAVTDGELPDYLPAVLDLAAADEAGWRLLREHRVGLDLLAEALAERDSVYRHVVTAVHNLLPPPSASDVAAALRLAGSGPPAEAVGLEPYSLTGDGERR